MQIWCRDAAMGVKLPGPDAKSKKEDYEGFRPRFQKIVDSCRVRLVCKLSRSILICNTTDQQGFVQTDYGPHIH